MSEDYLVPKCPKCNSFDVSIEVADNSIECRKCKYKGKEKIQINLQEFKEELQTKEQENIERFLNEDSDVFLGNLYGKR